jgi:hypothetical protein
LFLAFFVVDIWEFFVEPGRALVCISGSLVRRSWLSNSLSKAGALKSRTNAGGLSSKLACRSERFTVVLPKTGMVLVEMSW